MTTQAIVTEKNNTVIIEHKQPQVIIAGMIGPQGVTTIEGLQNIDISNIQNGSLLIYNVSTQKWTASNLLEQQIVESGQY
jgi:hypothetical protein